MSQRVFASKNPYTLELLKTYDFATPEDIENIIGDSYQAFQTFSQISFEERADKIRRVAQLLRERIDHLACLMTIEMGKPISASKQEISGCI